jgi:magnesium-transporting ATPase (P-type)
VNRTDDQRNESAPYRWSDTDVLAALNTDAQSGLSQEQARERLEGHGRNELTADAPVPERRKFPAQFTYAHHSPDHSGGGICRPLAV